MAMRFADRGHVDVPGADDDAVEPPAETVHVWFPMSGGPATAVGVPAEALAPDRVRLLFAPWAALNAAKADIYRVRKDDDGELWVQDKLEESGFCAIRLSLDGDGLSGWSQDAEEAALDTFAALGVAGIGMFGLTVIDVPPSADLRLVRQLLDEGQRDGWWEYLELCVTDEWTAATSR